MPKRSNVRTMKLEGIDQWDMPTYRCQETNMLWKDALLGESDTPDLHSCQNEFDGEPECRINPQLEIVYLDKYKVSKYQCQYMMLGRMQSDCKTHLEGAPWSRVKDIDAFISEMKEIWNTLPEGEKPEWLTLEQISEYEVEMKKMGVSK